MTALSESVKEFSRVVAFAAIPVLIDSLSASNFSWRGTLIALAIAVLRATDRYIHISPNTSKSGILPW